MSAYVTQLTCLFRILFFINLICESVHFSPLPVNLEILCSVQFDTYDIDVYADKRNPHVSVKTRKYFYSPIVLLNHTSARCVLGKYTPAEVVFRVEMWKSEIRDEILKYLNDFEGREINHNQLYYIPSYIPDKFKLTVFILNSFSVAHYLPSNMQKYKGDQFIVIKIEFSSKMKCKLLAETMRTNPQQFGNSKLLFLDDASNIVGIKTEIREFELKHIVSSPIRIKLIKRYEKEDDINLITNDKYELLNEAIRSILAKSNLFETFIFPLEGDFVSSILEKLKTIFVKSIHFTDWQSVHWDSEDYRPDKASRKLNEIYFRQPKENQNNMLDVYTGRNLEEGMEIPEFNFSLILDLSKEKQMTNESLERLYQESFEHVKWDGEKFTPYLGFIEVSTINMKKMRNEETLLKEKLSDIELNYRTIVVSIPVRMMSNCSSSETWFDQKVPISNNIVLIGNSSVNIDRSCTGKPVTTRRQFKCHLVNWNRTRVKMQQYYENEFNKLQTTQAQLANHLQKIQSILQRLSTVEKRVDTYLQRSVSFFVQKNNSFGEKGLVSFKINPLLNVGGGFNNLNGIFTAPVSGIYHFFFSALQANRETSGTSRLTVQLIVGRNRTNNAQQVLVEAHINSNELYGSFPLQIQATVRLEERDSVHVHLTEGCLYKNGVQVQFFTVFGGFLTS